MTESMRVSELGVRITILDSLIDSREAKDPRSTDLAHRVGVCIVCMYCTDRPPAMFLDSCAWRSKLLRGKVSSIIYTHSLRFSSVLTKFLVTFFLNTW